MILSTDTGATDTPFLARLPRLHSAGTGLALAVLLALGTASAAATEAQADPDALWKIVNGKCVPGETGYQNPKPCLAVDIAKGVAHGTALLKDPKGDTQMLLLPTARVTGIESPAVLATDATNYFAAAWADRSYLATLAHREPARNDIMLAINSAAGRNQNQLHIHIDCMNRDIEAALDAFGHEITESWAPFPVPLDGHPYWARRLEGPDLNDNPFKLLADGLPGAARHMGEQTLAVAGAILSDGQPGFYLLADHVGATPDDHARSEELQDHARACQ